MKELSELKFLDDARYSKEHEWARLDKTTVRIGITDFAQDQLGDIVFVDLPQMGKTFKKGETFGTVESVKAVSELYMPVGGEILSVNTSLETSPELVNKSPYQEGWMIEVKPDSSKDLESLLSKEAYINLLKGVE